VKPVVDLGPMLRFLEYFRRKKLSKKLANFVQNTAIFCQIWIITLVYKKNAKLFWPKMGKNRRKL
jgi:hypothetical protein